jgi:hypothetical protein
MSVSLDRLMNIPRVQVPAYCMGDEGIPGLPHPHALEYEQYFYWGAIMTSSQPDWITTSPLRVWNYQFYDEQEEIRIRPVWRFKCQAIEPVHSGGSDDAYPRFVTWTVHGKCVYRGNCVKSPSCLAF